MEQLLLGMEMKDWAMIIAALLGPILAVQAQKIIERIRAKNNRKTALFEQLMATRASRLSAEHVQALNMIDLVFYGKRIGFQPRSNKEQKVIEAWREYFDHLHETVTPENDTVWGVRREELFVNLLYTMAEDIGYEFDRVQLKRGVYSPVAHADAEKEQSQLRKALLSLMTGAHPLKMDVVGLPSDPEATANYKQVLENLSSQLSDGGLNVQIQTKKQH